MNAQQAIQAAADTSAMVMKRYLEDLSDQDLLRRPGEGCNHLAWQLGHLIAAECRLLEMLKPGAAIALPEGFAERHSKETIADDEPSHFHSKAEYLDLFDRARAATAAVLATTTDEELDAPNPNEGFREMFPTVGSMYLLTATHPMMHAGQFVPWRRALGKPVVI